MAQVSKERVLELQKIIKEECNRNISYKKASEIANGLVGYFDTLAKMNHSINLENGDKKTKPEMSGKSH